VTISIKQLFAHQTIAALSAAIASSAEVMQPAPQGAVSGRLDLLPIQQQLQGIHTREPAHRFT